MSTEADGLLWSSSSLAGLSITSNVKSRVSFFLSFFFFLLLLREKIGQRKGGRIDSFHWCSFMLFFYPAFLFQSYTSFSLSSSTYNVLDYFGGFCKLYSNIFFCKSVNSIKYPFDVYPLFFAKANSYFQSYVIYIYMLYHNEYLVVMSMYRRSSLFLESWRN